MTKVELARKVSEAKGITIKEATVDVDLIIGLIEAELTEGNDVALHGFGSLKVIAKPSRQGRNPKDGTAITIEAKKVVKFTMAKGLKDKVNN